jgi:hypothetical protein
MTGSDRWDPMSASERGGRDTLSGLHVAGPRGDSSAGPNRSPWPFILFFSLLVFLFLFSVFISIFCKKCFKPIQTSF